MFKVASYIAVLVVLTSAWQLEGQKFTCAPLRCPRVNTRACKFGVGLNACGCCEVCLSGLNAPCGGPWNTEGTCGTGLTCVKSDANDVDSVGTCKKADTLVCDCKTIKCSKVDPQSCKYGLGLDACGCCEACLLGPGATCGGMWDMEGYCGTGLTCVKKDSTDADSIGTCQVEKPQCACKPASCSAPECKYGVGKDSCDCCDVCLLGPGVTCGGPGDVHGKCGRNMACVKIDPKDANSIGTCRIIPRGK
ncbi:keratin-associated protein 5-1 [Hyalella azteca]|uniref:Keratin-associated protein 5-1 n=1 Tax=Hyalella azteca TaxID=294128 RepID=A0A8B7N4D3_HYAAZ|nr:keratin-associated protein 5-1 [Hyalella azteca]